MKKILFASFLSLAILFANDSEYYTSGNQLVPIQSANVRLEKEVLTVKHLKDYTFDVDVKYTLFNEGKERETVIGFESVGQVGDAEPENFFEKEYNDTKVLNAEKKAIAEATGDYKNEYLYNFKIIFNGKNIPYHTAEVDAIKKDKYTSPYVGSLYYFKVHLKKGLNYIHQTYKFDADESSLFYSYEFSYILNTAKRWKTGKIKDFTLILDMGNNQEFSIEKTFFKGAKYWTVKNGYIKDIPKQKDALNFYIFKGKAIFHKKDFTPNGVIHLKGAKSIWSNAGGIFDAKEDILPFAYHQMPNIATDAKSLSILKASVYARHGAVFKEKFINDYFKKCLWYKQNKEYKIKFSLLDVESQKRLKYIEKLKYKIIKNIPFAKRGYSFKNFDLRRFFETQNWYKENKTYKAKLSDLSKDEAEWIRKALSKKDISDEEFFNLLRQYEKLYITNKQ